MTRATADRPAESIPFTATVGMMAAVVQTAAAVRYVQHGHARGKVVIAV